jgi:hypothetical protein
VERGQRGEAVVTLPVRSAVCGVKPGSTQGGACRAGIAPKCCLTRASACAGSKSPAREHGVVGGVVAVVEGPDVVEGGPLQVGHVADGAVLVGPVALEGQLVALA